VAVRNRVKELRFVRAAELRPNPRNWRTHPEFQQRALRAVLDDVGFADALVARELLDGSLELIDGHLRAEILPDDTLPVLVLNVDEREADLLLATLDPLSALADCNRDAVAELCKRVETESDDLRELFERLSTDPPLAATTETDQPITRSSDPPAAMGESFQLVVECRDENDQRGLYERLAGEGYRCRVLTL
jgi:hypothetical protein